MKPNYDIKRTLKRFEKHTEIDIDWSYKFHYDEGPWDEGNFHVTLYAEYRGEKISRKFSTVKAYGELQWHLNEALHDIKNDFYYLEYMGYFDDDDSQEKESILGESRIY